MNELSQKFVRMQKMQSGTEERQALEREALVEIAGMNPGKFSEFLGNLPFMYGGRGNSWEMIIRPDEARLILKNRYNNQ